MAATSRISKKHFSPILDAIRDAESRTTAEIRVHLSRRLIEKDPFKRAKHLFHQYGMYRTTHRNAVLLYVNLRRRKFALIGDEGAHHSVGQRFWEELARDLMRNFISTHPENAIALAVKKIGERLAQDFPLDADHPKANELDDEVTRD
jgi:uncharacterized membrane protein